MKAGCTGAALFVGAEFAVSARTAGVASGGDDELVELTPRSRLRDATVRSARLTQAHSPPGKLSPCRVHHDCSLAAASAAAQSIAASFASTMFGSGFLSAVLLGTAGAAPGNFCSLREPKVSA